MFLREIPLFKSRKVKNHLGTAHIYQLWVYLRMYVTVHFFVYVTVHLFMHVTVDLFLLVFVYLWRIVHKYNTNNILVKI